MKTISQIKRVIENVKKDLRAQFKVKRIGIFGSYARKEQKKNSDLDLVVEIGQPISLLDLVKLENYLSALLRVKVDLIPKEDIRPELKDRILKETVYV